MSFSDPISADGARLREQHDYLRLLGARVTGGAANQMLLVALGWQMYDLTASAWELGLVGLAQFLPALLLTLPAGHLVDRHDRRLLLAGSLSLQCAVAACLALASAGGWVGPNMILLLSIVLGAARALQMPAQQALMPTAGSAVPAGRAPWPPAVPPCRLRSSPARRWAARCMPWGRGCRECWPACGSRCRPCQCPLGRGGGLLSRLRADGRRHLRRADHPATAGAAPAARAWPGGADCRHPLHLASPRDAGRDVAGPVRRAAGRRHGAASHLRARHPAHRPRRPGRAALGAGAGGADRGRDLVPHPDRAASRPQAAGRGGGLRLLDDRLRAGHLVLVRFRGAGDQRRGRHVQRRDPPVAGPARNPGRDARVA